MPKLTDHDRAEVEFFADFLRRVGPLAEVKMPEGHRRLRAWVAEDPEERLDYLGLPDKPKYQKLRADLLADTEAGEVR